jgi:hypothetical protein
MLWAILAVPWYPGVGTYPPDSGIAAWLAGHFWQALSAVALVMCATAWGLAVSAWAKKTAQASFVVPLLVIPQILFSGFVFPLEDWQSGKEDGIRARSGKAVVRGVARLVPGYSGQRLMETSVAWDQDADGRNDAARERAFENLRVLVKEADWLEFVNGKEQGVTWREFSPPLVAMLSLGAWTVLSMVGAVWGLRKDG